MLDLSYRAADIVVPMTPAEARQCVDEIKRGMVNIGRRLLELYERDGWQALGYASWRECAQIEFGYRQSHVYRLLEAATIERNISPMGEIESIPERQLRPLAPLEPEQQAAAWQRAVETAPGGKVTAAHVQNVVDEMRQEDAEELESGPTYYRLTGEFTEQTIKVGPDEELAVVKKPEAPAWYQSSESDDWWTPQWLFDLVSEEIAFETDVCASDANHKCERYFTREQDGLAQEWTGACWMNPPYGRSGGVSIYHWIEKAYWAAMQGATVACLIPARTDTLWWWEFCIHGEIRFLKGRLRFSNSNNSATFPSAVVIFWPYVPTNREKVIWWDTNGATEVEHG